MAGQPGQGDEPKGSGKSSPPTEGERTPEAPSQQQQGDKPDPQGEKPQPQGEKPDDKGQNPPVGENRPGQPRRDDVGGAVPHGNEAERWGVLPERVQQVFQNQMTDDLPVQYRDWIDSYYRRLNRGR